MRLLLVCCLAAVLLGGDGPADRAALDPTQAVPLLLAASRELADAAPDAAAPLADRLDVLARRIFLGGWRVPGRADIGLVERSIAAGDTLSRLAQRAGIPYDLLVRLNPGLDPRRLAIGTRLTVCDAKSVPLRLDVRLANHRLLVWRGPVLVLACPVGVGAGGTPTPTGATRIAVRAKDPEWRDPVSGKVHPPRSPGNMLGGYWLGFDAGSDGRFRSIGCHGWTGDDPAQWLEKGGSRGCLRLRQRDIADLYDLVLAGTAVDIR